MKAPPFSYVQASSLSDIFRLQRDADGEARLLAGGQSLLATLAFRLSAPTHLIDISRVAELKGIVATPDGGLRIGALTTHAVLGASTAVRQHAPLLADAVPLIAHPAIRNRGTIGGSLAWADPAAELPACCVALDATIVIARHDGGERRVPASQFFTGLFETALRPGEVIAAVEIPRPASTSRSVIVEAARRSGDYAMAGLAATTANGLARLVYFGVGATPVEAHAAAAALGAAPWSQQAIAAAQAALDRDLDPPADQHGGADMKRHLARVLLARAAAKLEASGKRTP